MALAVVILFPLLGGMGDAETIIYAIAVLALLTTGGKIIADHMNRTPKETTDVKD